MKAKIKIKTDVFLLNLKKASCTQKEFAGAAGISATYLNNLIHNRQPVGVKLKDMLRSTFKKMFPERKDLSCDFFYTGFIYDPFAKCKQIFSCHTAICDFKPCF